MSKKKKVVIKNFKETILTNQGLVKMTDENVKQDVVDTTVNQDQSTTSETQVDNTQEVQDTSTTEITVDNSDINSSVVISVERNGTGLRVEYEDVSNKSDQETQTISENDVGSVNDVLGTTAVVDTQETETPIVQDQSVETQTDQPVVETVVQESTEQPAVAEPSQDATQITTDSVEQPAVNIDQQPSTDTQEVVTTENTDTEVKTDPSAVNPCDITGSTVNQPTVEPVISQEQTTVGSEEQGITDQSTTQLVDPVVQPASNVVDQAPPEVVIIQAPTTDTIQTQDTHQQPTDQPASVDTSAVVNTPDVSVVSTAPEVIDTKDENLTEFEKFEKLILTEGLEHEKNLVLGLKDYLENMKPRKPMNHHEGLLKQRQLLEYIKGVLRLENKEHFKKSWKILIKYFDEHSKHGHALHESYVNRFTEHWSTGPDQLNAFRNLTHLLKETAQKGINGIRKTVNIDSVTKTKYFTEEERQKIVDFYN